MPKLTRRALLKSSIAGVSIAGVSAMGVPALASDITASPRKGRIHQSVCQWCYPHILVDQLAEYAATIGLRGVDLLQPEEYEIPRRYGLVCTMGYAGGGEIGKALNRVENHAAIEQSFRTNIPLAAKAGVPNVITFSEPPPWPPEEYSSEKTARSP